MGSGPGSGSGSGSGSRAGGGGGAKTPFRKVRQKGICENAEHESTANTKGGMGNGNRKKENKEQAREKGHKIASWHASADEGGGESSGTAVVANTNANMHWKYMPFFRMGSIFEGKEVKNGYDIKRICFVFTNTTGVLIIYIGCYMIYFNKLKKSKDILKIDKIIRQQYWNRNFAKNFY